MEKDIIGKLSAKDHKYACALAQVGRAKPQYIPTIISSLRNADLSKYKDSMRPLIEKDMAETLKIMTASGLKCIL